MAQDEQTAVYDFLYRDPSRIASYYAQLFEGLLKGVETSGQGRKVRETTIKSDVKIAAGEYKRIHDAITSRKEILDPHDTIVIDLITKLLGRIALDPVTAPAGALVSVTGQLQFADGSAIKALTSLEEKNFAELIGAGKDKPHKEKMDDLKGAKNLHAFMRNLDLPSLFVLQHNGQEYMGTVKPDGLQEPIGSFYYRYGTGSAPDMTVLGIRENSIPLTLSSPTPLLASATQFAGLMRSLFLPADAIPITPIAIYRRVGTQKLQIVEDSVEPLP